MIREILLIHHSHTDIGYTHPQPAIFELHHRFIEAALDLGEETASDPIDSRLKWTCEVTGTARAWWEQANSKDQERFLAMVRRGQLEVAALEWHLTPLADLRMLLRSLENVRFFRELGIPIRSAMNTDVNGVPWGLVDVLLDHQIEGFSMAINSHMGDAVHPRPGAFRWQAPSGRELTVWNGFQYWHAANVILKMPSSVDAVASALPPFLAEAERRGYPFPFLPLQITNPHHPDNAGPDPNIGPFVREWNSRHPEVTIRTILLSDVFDRLKSESLATLKGDWTDYWNFGAGSSARETTVFGEGLRTLDAAHQIRLWSVKESPREPHHLDRAHQGLALYAEHTWGADCSVSLPSSIETHLQWSQKSSYVYEGLAHARIAQRDALHRLAESARGDAPTFLIYNPLSVPVRIPMRLPIEGLEWALTDGVHHRQRLDSALGNIPAIQTAWCEIDLPALGFRTYPVASVPRCSSEGLYSEHDRIGSSRVALWFDTQRGGVRSLEVDGVEFVGDVDGFTFGVPILERPEGGDRKEMMSLDFSKFDPAEGWHDGWQRRTLAGELEACESLRQEGISVHWQRFKMDNGDLVTVTYQLFSDDPTVGLEVKVQSAGDSSPYSLALPFTLPAAGETRWHFDTAGALVEFDKEQLPNACRHFVTARRFVRMQTSSASLSIATPDLPLWKFGGMFFERSSALKNSAFQPVTLAWLSNNYWEVNFVADQHGETNYHFRLLLDSPSSAPESYRTSLPFMAAPRLHAFQKMGVEVRTAGSLFTVGGPVIVDAISRTENRVFFGVSNLSDQPVETEILPDLLDWQHAWVAKLDGSAVDEILGRFTILARQTIGVVLEGVRPLVE
jgi:alpha-mannosidase